MRTRRSVQNLASAAAFLGVTTLTALVAQPYLMRWLGKERFGLFRELTEGFGFLALLEFGLGGSLAPLLAASLGRGDDRGVRATVAAGMKAYAGVAALMVVAGLGLAAALPRLIVVPPALVGDLRLACLIQVAALPLVALLPFKSLVEARQQGYRVNLVLILQAVVTAAASLGLAHAGFGIAGQAAALALGSVAFYATLAGDGLRRDPGVLAAALREPVDADAARGAAAAGRGDPGHPGRREGQLLDRQPDHRPDARSGRGDRLLRRPAAAAAGPGPAPGRRQRHLGRPGRASGPRGAARSTTAGSSSCRAWSP